MNTTEQIPKSELIAGKLAGQRKHLQESLARLDAYAAVMAQLPDHVIDCCGPTDDWLQISSPSREQVETILSTLRAGRWEKSANHAGEAIDYEGVVDGVRVIIYSAQPPLTCRIEEISVEVPAHTRIERKLVCA